MYSYLVEFGYFQTSTRTKLTFFFIATISPRSCPCFICIPLPSGLCPHVVSLMLFHWLSLFPTCS
ncbi:hypothetical protein K443DRAFT_444029 [Laccaria amethystina LaAM-08-1]|uniref:Uncharacterized protein n=1 Tax=Laccaria amethystina LaAM-08-1 TaxID=1095629 RepID=A0A0C9XGM0_9AGAR|nr:hypothetical protein K443DRAFT_213183 [Laccaria amethystina LaAM-08-1]KIK04046.1 hypothetical protein K443DRAFT_444029 [Laccaria amethystina LaAM-08-1]